LAMGPRLEGTEMFNGRPAPLKRPEGKRKKDEKRDKKEDQTEWKKDNAHFGRGKGGEN